MSKNSLPVSQVMNLSNKEKENLRFINIPKELEVFRNLGFSAIPVGGQEALRNHNNRFIGMMQRYMGMGNVEVLFSDNSNGSKYFTQWMGGANGDEQGDRYRDLQNLSEIR